MSSLDPWGPSDPLGEALQFLRMNGAFYCRSEFTAPWGLTLPPMPVYLWFHVVDPGRAVAPDRADEPRRLARGITLLPHGDGHRCSALRGLRRSVSSSTTSRSASATRPAPRRRRRAEPTGLRRRALRSPRRPQPRPVCRRSSTSRRRDRRSSIGCRHAAAHGAEAKELRPGGEAVITRLADILVIQAIRGGSSATPAPTGWLGALQDPQIGRAISLIHRDPARPWTVASLAERLRCHVPRSPRASRSS